MEGGRYLGAGTYGCTFMPPLICKGSKKKDFGKVGKITTESLAQQEIRIANRLRKIPLASNYFLLPEPESCQPASEEKQSEPGLKECFDNFDANLPLEEFRQVTEPYGGKPFYLSFDSVSLHPKRFDFLRYMRGLLEAGGTLLLAQVCHYDLHPGNLLIDKHKTVKIIDFGLSFTSSSISQDLLSARWKRLKFGFESDSAHPQVVNAEAPEINIMNAIRNKQYDIETAIKLTVLGKQIFKDMERYVGITREASRDSLLEFWTTSEYAKQRNYVNLWRTYWPGFDAWSIGVLILEILSMIILLPEFVQGPFKEKKIAILSALRGLLNPNPKERLDCIEALAVFDPGSPWIQRFGTKWLSIRKQQRKI
jgi:serine/threonine protein kinase